MKKSILYIIILTLLSSCVEDRRIETSESSNIEKSVNRNLFVNRYSCSKDSFMLNGASLKISDAWSERILKLNDSTSSYDTLLKNRRFILTIDKNDLHNFQKKPMRIPNSIISQKLDVRYAVKNSHGFFDDFDSLNSNDNVTFWILNNDTIVDSLVFTPLHSKKYKK